MRADGTWNEAEQTAADTICPYCGVGCTLTLHVQDGEIVKATRRWTTTSRSAICASRAASGGGS